MQANEIEKVQNSNEGEGVTPSVPGEKKKKKKKKKKNTAPAAASANSTPPPSSNLSSNLLLAADDPRCLELRDAARSGNEDTVKSLLKVLSSQRINAADDQGSTALHIAAYYEHANIVALLLPKLSQEQRNARNNEGYTPLHVAVHKNHVEIVKLLLEKLLPEQINLTDNKGHAPLHLAIFGGYTNIAALISEKLSPEQINLPNKDGSTALHIAAQKNNEEITALLLAKLRPDQINAPNNEGCTALHFAIYCGHKKIAALILARLNSEQMSVPNHEGFTALHFSAKNNQVEIAALLLKELSPEQINLTDKEGSTALHLAAYYGHTEIASLLLEKLSPEQMSWPGKEGYTALHFAVQEGHLEIVELLLEKLSPEQISGPEGQRALQIAICYKHTNIVKLLLEKLSSKKAEVLHTVIFLKQAGIINLPLEFTQASVNAIHGGLSVLNYAIENKDQDTVKTLLDRPEIDLSLRDDTGKTALEYAKEQIPPQPDIIGLLEEKHKTLEEKFAPKTEPVLQAKKPDLTPLSSLKEWEEQLRKLAQNPPERIKLKRVDTIIDSLKERSRRYSLSTSWDFDNKKEEKKVNNFDLSKLRAENYYQMDAELSGKPVFIHVSKEVIEKAKNLGVWEANEKLLLSGGVKFTGGDRGSLGVKKIVTSSGTLHELVIKGQGNIGDYRLYTTESLKEQTISGVKVLVLELDGITNHAGIKKIAQEGAPLSDGSCAAAATENDNSRSDAKPLEQKQAEPEKRNTAPALKPAVPVSSTTSSVSIPLEKPPAFSFADSFRQTIDFLESKQYAEAISVCEGQIIPWCQQEAIRSGKPQDLNLRSVYLVVAEAYFQLGSFEQALENFKIAQAYNNTIVDNGKPSDERCQSGIDKCSAKLVKAAPAQKEPRKSNAAAAEKDAPSVGNVSTAPKTSAQPSPPPKPKEELNTSLCITICAYLAPEISISLFKQIMNDYFSHPPQHTEEALKFWEGRALLKLDSDNSIISMEPTAQKLVQQTLETDQKKQACSFILKGLADILNKKNNETLADTVRSLEPHLKSIIHHHQQIHPDLFPAALAVASSSLADFYSQSPDKQQESYHYYSLALKAIEKNAGKNTIDSANILNSLARASGSLNKFEEQREHLLGALAIEEALYGHTSPRLITTLRNLVNTYIKLKQSPLIFSTAQRIRDISTTSDTLSETEQDSVNYVTRLVPGAFLAKVPQESKEEEPKKPAAAKPVTKSSPTLGQFKKHSNPLVYPILLFCTHLTPQEISVSLLTKLVNQYQSLQNKKNSDISEKQLEVTLHFLHKQKYLNYDNAEKSILAPPPAKKLITNSSFQQQREYLEDVQNTLGEIKKLDMGTARDYADRLIQVRSNLERAEKGDQDEKSAQPLVSGAVPLAPNSAQFAARYGILPEPAGLGPASPQPLLPLDADKGQAPQQH